MGNCLPVPHHFQRSSSRDAVPGIGSRDYALGAPGMYYAVPGMIPLPENRAQGLMAAEALGKELTRALKKTGVPIDRPLVEDLTVNFGIGLADDPRIAQMMVATSEDDEWADG